MTYRRPIPGDLFEIYKTDPRDMRKFKLYMFDTDKNELILKTHSSSEERFLISICKEVVLHHKTYYVVLFAGKVCVIDFDQYLTLLLSPMAWAGRYIDGI